MTGVLFPLIARGPMVGRREVDRYAAWRAALAAVAADFRRAPVAVEDLASYLAGVPADQQGEAALDLVAAHLDIAWRASAGPTLEDYVAALGGVRPELASLGGLARDLIEDEFLARHNVPHGDAPTIAEYAARFPGREDVLALLAARALGDGRYILLRRLGRGGEGEVWQAHDRHLGRHVAVKTLAAGAGDGGERARLLATEARRAAALDHPGVVTIHDYSAPPDASPFYVMGLLDGPTLADQIRGYHNPPFDRPDVDQRLLWRRLLAEFTFVCRAVAAAHDRGVVHGDLTPANVLTDRYGGPAVADWSAGAVQGTPEYMAPEQADGPPDQRSDVFGLGAILYEILTDRPPHPWARGPRPADWRPVVRQARVKAPRQVRGATPRALDAICSRALAREPGQRYESAAALARDVECYLAGEAVSARTEAPWSRAWRRLRRGL